MNKIEKAAPGYDRNGFSENLITGGDISDFINDVAITVEKLQEDLTACLTAHKPRIHKTFRCEYCKTPYSIMKLKKIGVCKKCINAARSKSKAEQRRFLASLVANFQRNLRGELSL